jgi:UDP-GlcNAc:undecaprenyl-phosphate GlcNAc-1-phosphate transferase
VDAPDQKRKLHHEPVPRLGGLAVGAAYLLAYSVWLLTPLQAGAILNAHLSVVGRMLPAALVVVAYGLADDLRGLKPRDKILGETIAACLVWWAGVRMESVAGFEIAPWASLPLTIMWLLLCTNAFNLIDGMDGLATSMALVGSAATLLAALWQGNIALALAVAPLAGALAGFLRYNKPPASIFLGDCGSLLVGFLLGSFALLWSQKSATLLGLAAPVMAVALPLLDTSVAIGRRFLSGRPLFGADRGHIHHRLLDQGLTPGRALAVLFAAAGCAALLSLGASVLRQEAAAFAVLVFFVLAWAGIGRLRYVEFGAARRWLARGAMREELQGQIVLERMRREMNAAQRPEECWRALDKAAGELGFREVELHWLGQVFRSSRDEPGAAWTMSVPISEGETLELRRSAGLAALAQATGPFADTAAEMLRSKQDGLRSRA